MTCRIQWMIIKRFHVRLHFVYLVKSKEYLIFWAAYSVVISGYIIKMLCCAYDCAAIAILWAYPLLQTYSSIQKASKEQVWLSYWLIMALVCFVESNILYFVLDYLYGYGLIKLAAALWLIHPSFKGAEYISENFYGEIYRPAEAILKTTPLYAFLEGGPPDESPKEEKPNQD